MSGASPRPDRKVEAVVPYQARGVRFAEQDQPHKRGEVSGALTTAARGKIVVAVLPLIGIAATGCSSRDDALSWTVTDSAGIEIVTNAGTGEEWTLSGHPTMDLGVVDQGGPTEFFRIADVAILDDGALAVANSGTEEVRLFSLKGRFLGSFGREGHGPREFTRLSRVEGHNDSLMTYDGGNDRVSVWTSDGTWVRSFRLQWFGGSLVPVDLMGGDGVLAITARYMTELKGSGLLVDTALVSHYDATGQLIDSLVRLPHNERVVQRQGDFQATLGAPFSELAQIVGVGDGFCYAFGPVAEIRCYDLQGTLRRIVRAPLAQREVTDAQVADFWDRRLSEATGPRLDAFRRMRGTMPFPVAFPAFSQLLVDDDRRLWARVYALPDETAERWFVFDDGRLLSEIRSPMGFRVMDVRNGRVAGVWANELGVEFVRVYRISSELGFRR